MREEQEDRKVGVFSMRAGRPHSGSLQRASSRGRSDDPNIPPSLGFQSTGFQSSGAQRRVLPQSLAAGEHAAIEMSTHPGAHRKVEGSGVHVHGINQQSDDEEIVSPDLLSARTFVHKKEECHARAQERWEEVSIHLIQRRMSNGGKGRKITINASGLTCVTYEGYLRRFPGTLLSDMVVEGSLQKKNVHFLDRHPFAVYEIVNCYRDEFLPEKPPHIPTEVWQNELLHFRMHKSTVQIPGFESFVKLYKELDNDDHAHGIEDPETFRSNLVLFLEDPKSSKAARVVGMFSALLVLFSVFIVLTDTVQDCQQNPDCVKFIFISDVVVTSIFTLEFVVRFLASMNKFRFITTPLNVVDLMSILPTWLTLAFKDNEAMYGTAKVLRVLRIMRIFKLARHNAGLLVFYQTALAARTELSQVGFCFLIAVLLFASVVFYAEESVPDEEVYGLDFTSIPDSMWWAVITLCTVGYGDMSPVTGLGKFFGGLCCICGVIMVALPISVISRTFEEEFEKHVQSEKIADIKRIRYKAAVESLKEKGFGGPAAFSVSKGSLSSDDAPVGIFLNNAQESVHRQNQIKGNKERISAMDDRRHANL